MPDRVVVKLFAVAVAGGDAPCCVAIGSTPGAEFGARLELGETSTMLVAFPSRKFGAPTSARAHFVKAGRMFNDTFR